ncbi:hypothetical protein CALCODRAFT_512803 [Calocera cornea HHB12733]|uniref:DUF1771 domain-containing protein n=1 Tax=Calocera cornea HHB12733 TaxID=1353952 RepID=A0A165CRY1_9BASI|nr:hypothetical protein CALCODRAFT_512803 [Calocera cornea HHB12733]
MSLAATNAILLSVAPLAHPSYQIQRGTDVKFSEDVGLWDNGQHSGLRSDNEIYNRPNILARGNKHEDYQRKADEAQSMYKQWHHAFNDAHKAMIAASNTMSAQVYLRLNRSPHFSATTYNQAKTMFDHQTKALETAERNCDYWKQKLASLKPPKRKRYFDFEDLNELD